MQFIDLNGTNRTSWNSITNKPAVYPPSTHTHLDQEDLPEFWLQNLISNAVASRAPIQHTHSPHRGPGKRDFPTGLAANSSVLIFGANSLERFKAYVIIAVCG